MYGSKELLPTTELDCDATFEADGVLVKAVLNTDGPLASVDTLIVAPLFWLVVGIPDTVAAPSC